jgi:hypothetical protein
MIYIWRGWGIVVPIVWFVTLWGVQLVANTIFGAGTYEGSGLLKIIASIPAGFFVWIVGNLLNEEIEPNSHKHSFFFIPAEYWGAIIPILTVVMKIIF